MTPISVSQDELTAHGYTEIAHQTEDGEVILRDESGHLEVFQAFLPSRDSYSGWCLYTEDDRCLEFVRAVTHWEGTTSPPHPEYCTPEEYDLYYNRGKRP